MKINIKGDIIQNDHKWIYDWFGWDACCPNDIHSVIENAEEGETLDVEINSGGGDVFAGSEIYTALKGYTKGGVNIMVSGLAASAASVIAMSGKSKMSPTALMMVHNVSGGCRGDYRDMEHMTDVLKSANQAIASAYVNKTGMDISEALKLMDNETWLPAVQAKEYGLIDEIAFEVATEPLTNGYGFISPEVIDKLSNLISKPNLDAKLKAKAELEILKIKNIMED